MAIRQIKNGAKICDGHRTGQGQRFPRHQTQGAGEAVSAEGRATQARQIRSRDGARNRRLRALREALPRVVEGLQGQKMSQVRQEAFGSSRPRKEKALSSKEVKRNVVDSLNFSSYNGMSYTGMSHTGVFRDLSDENHLFFCALF